jgi:hypothetical protein
MIRPTLRAGTDADAETYIRLIGSAWAEHPGIVFDVDAELPELRHLATHFARLGGRLWLEAEGRGMIATRPMRASTLRTEEAAPATERAISSVSIARKLR